MRFHLQVSTFIAIGFMATHLLAASPSGSSTTYAISTDTLASGGTRATSAAYTAFYSTGGIVGSSTATNYTNDHGFIAQLSTASAVPAITNSLVATGTVGATFTYAITASNSPTNFNATGLPSGLSVNTSTGAISGTPTTAESSSVTLSATNAGGTGTATLTITISSASTATAPTITSALTASSAKGSTFTYTITATGSQPITFSATGLPAGLGFTTDTISGVPTVSGQTSIVLAATNAAGAVSKTLVLTITSTSGGTNNAPAFSSLPTASPNPGVTGASITFNATATDSDGDLLSYTWNFGDGSANVGASVTHTYTTAGVFSASVIASDGIASDTRTITVAVNSSGGDGTGEFSVLKASIKFNFLSTGKDSITLSGTILVDQGFSSSNKTFMVSIGDHDSTFTLDSHGKGASGFSSIKLSIKSGSTFGKFIFSTKKSTLFSDLEDLGFINDDVAKPGEQIDVPVIMSLDGVGYLDTPTLTYTAKKGKTGSAKQ